jgi:hypothetical protein
VNFSLNCALFEASLEDTMEDKVMCYLPKAQVRKCRLGCVLSLRICMVQSGWKYRRPACRFHWTVIAHCKYGNCSIMSILCVGLIVLAQRSFCSYCRPCWSAFLVVKARFQCCDRPFELKWHYAAPRGPGAWIGLEFCRMDWSSILHHLLLFD